MNRLKSYFVTALVTVSTLIAIASVFFFFTTGMNLDWLGSVVAVLPFLVFFSWIFWVNRKTVRTTQRLPLLSAVAVFGVGLSAYGVFGPQGGSTAALVLAVIAAAGFLLYTNWYSFFGRGVSATLKRGAELPEVSFEDVDGNTVTTSDLRGSPALLMFYRGNWCPICTAQVAEVADRYKELIDRGISVSMISPQPHNLTRRVAELYGINVNFWVDVEGKAAKVLGVYHEEGVPLNARGTYGADTVLPTAIITDQDGKILFADQTENYRIRPNPDIFLEVLASHGY